MLEAHAAPHVSCNHGSDCQCQHNGTQPQDMDFDVTRTFSLLLVTLVLPMYLAISMVSFSLAAIY